MKIFNESVKGRKPYTIEAKDIQKEICDILEPLFNKYIKLGYEPNEIHYLMSMSINDLTLDEILGLNNYPYVKENNKSLALEELGD